MKKVSTVVPKIFSLIGCLILISGIILINIDGKHNNRIHNTGIITIILGSNMCCVCCCISCTSNNNDENENEQNPTEVIV